MSQHKFIDGGVECKTMSSTSKGKDEDGGGGIKTITCRKEFVARLKDGLDKGCFIGEVGGFSSFESSIGVKYSKLGLAYSMVILIYWEADEDVFMRNYSSITTPQ